MSNQLKYQIKGSRAGDIQVQINNKTGKLGWELLGGESMFAIYSPSCEWSSPSRSPMSQSEIEAISQIIANEHNIQIEVSVGNEFKIIKFKTL